MELDAIARIAASGGRPLDFATRVLMESLFGCCFDHVRIHVGTETERIVAALNARACTYRSDIFFAAGAYAPETVDGRRLLAHELAHVVQQGQAGDRPARPTGVGSSADGHELEADSAADQAMRGVRVPRLSCDASGLLRRNVRIGDSSLAVSLPQGRRAWIETNAIGPHYAVSEAQAHFHCSPIFIKGLVDLATMPGGSLAGCVVGFVQLQFIETSRFRYRGMQPGHGSMSIDRAAARPQQLCRDGATRGEGRASAFGNVDPPRAWSPVWYADPEDPLGPDPFGDRMQPTRFLAATDTAPGNGTLMVRTDLFDSPDDRCRLILHNSATGEPNFLREAELELHFCSILAAIIPGPSVRIRPLKHVYWNVIWHALFTPGAVPGATWRIQPVGLHGMHVQAPPHSGAPDDPRFRDRIGDTGLPNCNAVAFRTFHRPVNHPPSHDWRWALR